MTAVSTEEGFHTHKHMLILIHKSFSLLHTALHRLGMRMGERFKGVMQTGQRQETAAVEVGNGDRTPGAAY